MTLWKSIPSIKLVEITKSSHDKVRPGSLAYIVGYCATSPLNSLSALLIILRNGRRGQAIMAPMEVTTKLVDFTEHFSGENLDLLNTQAVAEIEGLVDIYRHRTNVPIEVEITPFQVQGRNILEWDTWLFIGLLIAQSCRLNMRHRGTAPHSMVYSTKSMSKYSLQRTIRDINEKTLLEKDPMLIGQHILRQLAYDAKAKDGRFREMLLKSLESSERRREHLIRMIKAHICIAQRVLTDEKSSIYDVYNDIVERAMNIIKYYNANPEILQKLKAGEKITSFLEHEAVFENKKKKYKYSNKLDNTWIKEQLEIQPQIEVVELEIDIDVGKQEVNKLKKLAAEYMHKPISRTTWVDNKGNIKIDESGNKQIIEPFLSPKQIQAAVNIIAKKPAVNITAKKPAEEIDVEFNEEYELLGVDHFDYEHVDDKDKDPGF